MVYNIFYIWKVYTIILHLHGIYIATSFLKYMLSTTCYYCYSIYEYFYPPQVYKQIGN